MGLVPSKFFCRFPNFRLDDRSRCIALARFAQCPSSFICSGSSDLSLTREPLGEGGGQCDIGEAREAAPHDHGAGRRILGAGEVAAELGDLGQIVGKHWCR